MRLFKYITDNNKEQMEIKMTVPVTMQMKTSENSDSLEYRTMSFFIPFKHQRDAPIPSADDVSLTVDKPFCAYVKVYGGWANREKIESNYKTLAEALKRDGLGDDFSTALTRPVVTTQFQVMLRFVRLLLFAHLLRVWWI